MCNSGQIRCITSAFGGNRCDLRCSSRRFQLIIYRLSCNLLTLERFISITCISMNANSRSYIGIWPITKRTAGIYRFSLFGDAVSACGKLWPTVSPCVDTDTCFFLLLQNLVCQFDKKWTFRTKNVFQSILSRILSAFEDSYECEHNLVQSIFEIGKWRWAENWISSVDFVQLPEVEREIHHIGSS